jgi:hypothetical protein
LINWFNDFGLCNRDEKPGSVAIGDSEDMSMPLLVQVPVALLMILLLFGFVGCNPPFTKYTDDTILANASSSGLVAYWPLGESSGTTANDQYSHQYDGAYTSGTLTLGAPGIVPGDTVQPGNDPDVRTTCMEVDGGYVEVQYDPALNPPSSPGFSIEAWVRISSAGGGTERIVMMSRDPGADTGFELLANSVDRWEFRVGQSGTSVAITAEAVRPDTTTHLVAVYDGSTDELRLYVDNWDFGPVSASPAYAPNGSVPLTIGAGPAGSMPIHSRIQDVAVYKGALSATDVDTHFHRGNGQA